MTEESLTSPPSHSKIFEYWKDKCITYNGEIKTEGKHAYSESIAVVKDWGEPECWCCGKFINLYNNTTYDYDLETNIYKIWDYAKVRKSLNRCHIVPKALGGSYETKNMFLMCETCHYNSPSHIDPKYFFHYILMQRSKYHGGIEIYKMYKDLIYIANSMNKDIFTYDINIVNKIINDRISSHGGRVSDSSIIAAICDSMQAKVYTY